MRTHVLSGAGASKGANGASGSAATAANAGAEASAVMQALQPLNAREQLPGYGAQDGKNMGTGRMRHGEFEAINAKIQVKTALPFM